MASDNTQLPQLAENQQVPVQNTTQNSVSTDNLNLPSQDSMYYTDNLYTDVTLPSPLPLQNPYENYYANSYGENPFGNAQGSTTQGSTTQSSTQSSTSQNTQPESTANNSS